MILKKISRLYYIILREYRDQDMEDSWKFSGIFKEKGEEKI